MAGSRIAIFGAGYVGLVTGACFAELGHEVVVRDVISEKIEALQAGEVPIYEPGLDELLGRNRERLAFTLDVREAIDGAEFVYIAVDTPPTYSGDADLSRVWTVIDELPQLGGRPVVVMKSTVPVGTGEKVRAALEARGLGHVGYVSNPEFTAEGTGADVVQVARGVGLDHRLGPHFLRAGIGYGGSCFPKDSLALKQLASNSGYHFQLLNAVIEVNELQKRRVIGKLKKHLGSLGGTTVALLGLAFKPNTDDMREAPSIVLASRLLAEGAEVRAWDPVADARELLQGVAFCETPLEAVAGADAAVIVTEWPQLRALASAEIRSAMRRPLIVDGRNLLDPAEVRAAGFAYEAIGRPTAPFGELAETAERAPEPEFQQ